MVMIAFFSIRTIASTTEYAGLYFSNLLYLMDTLSTCLIFVFVPTPSSIVLVESLKTSVSISRLIFYVKIHCLRNNVRVVQNNKKKDSLKYVCMYVFI